MEKTANLRGILVIILTPNDQTYRTLTRHKLHQVVLVGKLIVTK